MKLYFPALTVIRPEKYQMDFISYEHGQFEIYLDSRLEVGDMDSEDHRKVIRWLSKLSYEELNSLRFRVNKRNIKLFNRKIIGKLPEECKNNRVFKEMSSKLPIDPKKQNILDKKTKKIIELRLYLIDWARIFKRGGETLWESRKRYYATIDLIQTFDFKTMYTYLMNESLHSISNVFKFLKDDFDDIDSTATLDKDSYDKYQKIEIALSSLNSNITKISEMIVDEKDLEEYRKDDEYNNDEKECEHTLDQIEYDTRFYLDSYKNMVRNLLSQIETESHIRDTDISEVMNKTLEKFTVASIVLAVPAIIFAYFGTNYIDKETPLTDNTIIGGAVFSLSLAICVGVLIFFIYISRGRLHSFVYAIKVRLKNCLNIRGKKQP